MSRQSASDSILQLIRDGLTVLETERESVSEGLRKAIRVARLSGDYHGLFWLQYEMVDGNDDFTRIDLLNQLVNGIGRDEAETFYKSVNDRYNEERKYFDVSDDGLKFKTTPSYLTVAVDEIEAMLQRLRVIRIDNPTNHYEIIGKLRNIGAEAAYSKILGRIRQRIHTYLTEMEHRYEVGEVNSGIFDSYRHAVDSFLTDIAPDVLSQFTSVYRRLSEADDEARSHALTSCRRILNALADIVYPAQSEPAKGTDGKMHAVGQENYLNRLWQFVAETEGLHKNTLLLRAQIGDVERRFDALQGLASKGTHGKVSTTEVYQCAIQTYLVAGDVLRIYRENTAKAS